MTDQGLVFKIVLISNLVLTLMLSVEGAPADLQKELVKNCTDGDDSKGEENEYTEIIDQSQNGTDNYRLSIKDVVIIVAPASSVLAGAGSLLESQVSNYLESQVPSAHKPETEENRPPILDLVENKPSGQNSSESVAPEKENEKPAIINPEAKTADFGRGVLDLPTLLGPFLRRKQNA